MFQKYCPKNLSGSDCVNFELLFAGVLRPFHREIQEENPGGEKDGLSGLSGEIRDQPGDQKSARECGRH